MHFAGKFSRGPQVKERALLGLGICLWEYTQKVVPLKVAAALISVQRRVQLEHSSHLVKVCVEVRC